jgi:uncharacterized protein
MSTNKLSTRLGYIRKQDIAEKNTSVKKGRKDLKGGPEASAIISPPAGWSRAGNYTWAREEEISFPHPEIFSADPLLGAPIAADKLIFFDTETTGLSGGAGTLAFLLGTAVLRNQRLRLKQFLLTDFPGESEYLRETLKIFSPDLLYVSYNGKSFDSHLLATRYVMNRLHFSFPFQLDLLYPARRLWRGVLDSCSLAVIEREVLKVKREGDIPGFEIPFTYFRFLETKDFTELLPVARHNLQDLISLARLFIHMKNIFADPCKAGLVDRFSLGRMLLEQGDPSGAEIIHRSFARGNMKAGRYLGLHYKRSGLHSAARKIWEQLWGERADPAAGIELAKYFEHRVKDYRQALRLTEAVYSSRFFEEGEKEAIMQRLKRLRRKLKAAD